MEIKHDKRSWKKLLIRKDVQLPLVAANMAFLIFVTAILIVVLLSPLYMDMLKGNDVWTQNVSGNLFLILLRRLSLAMLLILVVASVHQIILSHRFCGPLVNFNFTFEKMIRGDFSRKVYLRKNDFLKAEAAKVNGIIDRLSADGDHLDRNLTRIAEITAQLENQSETIPSQALLEEIKRSIAACRETLSEWHYPTDPK